MSEHTHPEPFIGILIINPKTELLLPSRTKGREGLEAREETWWSEKAKLGSSL